MMPYCETCKIHVDKQCQAGYQNPTTDVTHAMNQALRKGEWPCSFAPHREEFIAWAVFSRMSVAAREKLI